MASATEFALVLEKLEDPLVLPATVSKPEPFTLATVVPLGPMDLAAADLLANKFAQLVGAALAGAGAGIVSVAEAVSSAEAVTMSFNITLCVTASSATSALSGFSVDDAFAVFAVLGKTGRTGMAGMAGRVDVLPLAVGVALVVLVAVPARDR